MQVEIPLSSPDIGAKEIALVNHVLSGPYLSMGPMVRQFEDAFANHIGTKHAIGVNSGTSGLHLCMAALGIEGLGVVTTPFSFVASANCILYERGVPIFVDIDHSSLNVDMSQLDERLSVLAEDRKVPKAILPVHVFGQPCEMSSLMAIANRYGCAVIEDACEALGSEYQGQKVGTFGTAAVFAFYPNKQMTTGEGGMIVTDDDEIAELCRSMRNQGRDNSGRWLHHIRLGYNYRLDEMSAALGIGQLQRIEELISKREKVASWYNDRLSKASGVQIPQILPDTTRMGWFVYVVRLAASVDRTAVMNELEMCGIPSRPYFTPIHLQPFYRSKFGFMVGDFPVTEAVASSTLALPFFGKMTEEQVDYVCRNLQRVIG